MRRVVAAFVEAEHVLGRCSVHVGCCVLLIFVVMECSTVIVMVCGGVNDDETIEYSS